MVLEMGEPVRILDVARRMIDAVRSARDIEIVFTGLRPGEKLAECALGGRGIDATAQPMVRSVRIPPVNPNTCRHAAIGASADPAVDVGPRCPSTAPRWRT